MSFVLDYLALELDQEAFMQEIASKGAISIEDRVKAKSFIIEKYEVSNTSIFPILDRSRPLILEPIDTWVLGNIDDFRFQVIKEWVNVKAFAAYDITPYNIDPSMLLSANGLADHGVFRNDILYALGSNPAFIHFLGNKREDLYEPLKAYIDECAVRPSRSELDQEEDFDWQVSRLTQPVSQENMDNIRSSQETEAAYDKNARDVSDALKRFLVGRPSVQVTPS